MKEKVNNRAKQYWGRHASRNLVRTFNCSESTLQSAQDMVGMRDDTILRASSTLAGGMVARGSTCGAVVGGALALALIHDDTLCEDGSRAEIALLSIVGDYVDWFQGRYGATLCRERARVDFWTLSGFLRYLIPPDRFLGCVSHINGALQYLYDTRDDDAPSAADGDVIASPCPFHCARTVLEEVRKQTGVGDPRLERAAVVFDGGVGLRGGTCGALAGAIMIIGMLMSINLRDASWLQAYRDMLLGLHTLRAGEFDRPDDPYAVAGGIVRRFENEAGSLDCSVITGKTFTDWVSFRAHLEDCDTCSELVAFAVNETVSAIERYRSHMGHASDVCA